MSISSAEMAGEAGATQWSRVTQRRRAALSVLTGRTAWNLV